MRQLILAAAFAFVSACGFRPVYAGGETGAISVDTIPGRTGHALRKALLRDLAAGLPGVTEHASLDISLNETLTQLAFTPDGAASRSSVITQAAYTLSCGDDQTVTGEVRSEATFNVPDAPYGDISAQVAASERAAKELSRLIVEDLRIKLFQSVE